MSKHVSHIVRSRLAHSRQNYTLTAPTMTEISKKVPQIQVDMWRACFGMYVTFKLPAHFRRGTTGRKHNTSRTPHLLAGITAAVAGRLSRYTNGLEVGAWVGHLSRHTNGLDVGAWNRGGEGLGHMQGAREDRTGRWHQVQVPPPPVNKHKRTTRKTQHSTSTTMRTKYGSGTVQANI